LKLECDELDAVERKQIIPPRIDIIDDAVESADRRWIRDVTGALSVPALVEFLELVDTTQHVPLSPDVPDQVQWKLTASGVYSAESAYRAFFTGMGLFPCGKAI
jgi:hypothetical protein